VNWCLAANKEMATKEMCDEDSYSYNRLANLHVQKLVLVE